MATQIRKEQIRDFPQGGGGAGFGKVAQTPIGVDSTYLTLSGVIDGVNKVFTVPGGKYLTGKILVMLNGMEGAQGTDGDWFELDPDSGTIEFTVAPEPEVGPTPSDVITVYYTDTDESPSDGGGIVETVTQIAHGFVVGDIIKSSGVDNEYAKAQADSEMNAEVIGIVTNVADLDTFTYAKDIVGYVGAGIPVGVAGNAVWLSATTAGAMTFDKPIVIGQVQKPLGQITASGASMNFTADMRGEVVSEGGGFGGGGGTKLAIDTTQFTTSSGSFVDAYTVNIPGGTLGENDAIRFSVIISNLDLDSGESFLVKALYGGTEITPEIEVIANPGSFDTLAKITGLVIADNSTSVQKSSMEINFQRGDLQNYGTGTVDSTVDQDLVIQFMFDDSGNTVTAESIIVEKITESGTGSGNIISLTANEDIEAGQPVGVVSNTDEVALANFQYRNSGIAKVSTNIGVGVEVSSGKVVVPEFEPTFTGDLYLRVLNIDVDTKEITSAGTAVIASSIKRDSYVSNIIKIAENKFVIAYFTDGVGDENGYLVCGTVSGDTITLGSRISYGSTLGDNISLVEVDTDKFVIGWTASGGTAVLHSYTVSGNTISYGSSINPSYPFLTGGKIVKLDTDKIAVATVFASTTVFITVFTLSGPFFTPGTPLNTGITAYTYIGLYSQDTDKFIIVNFKTGNLINLYSCSVSGTTPTIGTVFGTTFSGEFQTTALFIKSPTSILGNISGRLFELTESANVLSFVNDTVGALGIAGLPVRVNGSYESPTLSIGGKFADISLGNNYNLYLEGNTNTFIGVATETKNKGEQIRIQTSGTVEVDSGTTLYPGVYYRISEGGYTGVNVGTNGSDYSLSLGQSVVKAISSNEVII